MENHRPDSELSTMIEENFNAIDSCPCDEEYEDIRSPSVLSSIPYTTSSWEHPIVVYRQNTKRRSKRLHCAAHRRRIVEKNGRAIELVRKHVQLRYTKYLRDVSNTMVNGRWRWVICAVVVTVSALWLIFAWFWMLISHTHGDLDGNNPPNETCVVGVEGFAGFLLMSIETQTTIGYGSRYPTENCPEGVFMLCFQMIIAIGVEGAVLGMFYVKMTRPRIRDCRKLFSRIAVVCQRDGVLCLMWRICDPDRSHIVGTQLRAYLTETRHTQQGEHIEAYQQPLELEPTGLLLWPIIVLHRIDKNSPLYDVSAGDLLVRKFEIIVTMIGSSDSTGQLTQSRTSYLASEIHWGHRFKQCVYYDEDKSCYVIQKKLFHTTEIVDTPLCSAQRLNEVLRDVRNDSGFNTITTGLSSLPSDTVMSSPVTLSPSSPSSPTSPIIRFEDIEETDV